MVTFQVQHFEITTPSDGNGGRFRNFDGRGGGVPKKEDPFPEIAKKFLYFGSQMVKFRGKKPPPPLSPPLRKEVI